MPEDRVMHVIVDHLTIYFSLTRDCPNQWTKHWVMREITASKRRHRAPSMSMSSLYRHNTDPSLQSKAVECV